LSVTGPGITPSSPFYLGWAFSFRNKTSFKNKNFADVAEAASSTRHMVLGGDLVV